MLNLQITLIVPSKTQDGKKLNLNNNAKECLVKMCNLFGGATASGQQSGCFIMQNGIAMFEKNISIISYTDAENDLKEFFDFVLEIKAKYNQECIAVIINNVMRFI